MYCDKTEVPAAAAQAKLALLTMYGCLIFRPTVPLVSPVQHVYPCSEMRHCKHRHHRAWRCGTRQQVYQHTFLSSSSPPRKVDAAHRKCWTSAQELYNTTGVKAGLQVQGLPERYRHKQRYSVLTCVRGKSQQLSNVVSSSGSQATC